MLWHRLRDNVEDQWQQHSDSEGAVICPPFVILKGAERNVWVPPNLQKYQNDIDISFENKKFPPEKIMKKGQRMSKASQRAAEIRRRNELRRSYEFSKKVLKSLGPKKTPTSRKKSSTKYSQNDIFTQILNALWKIISKILKIY